MQSDQITTSGYRNKLTWVALYSDNTIFPQYSDGKERSSEQVDRSKLVAFTLYDLGGNKYVEQRFKSGQLFMYRCRTILKTGHNIIERIHIIVCQENDKRHVVFVFESDLHIEIADFVDSNDLTFNQCKWLHPLEPVPSDLIPVGTK